MKKALSFLLATTMLCSAQMTFVSDGNDSVFFSRINEISALLGKDAFTVAKVNNK